MSGGRIGFDILSSYHSKSGFYRNHTNEKLNELIDRYPQTKDPAAKKQIAREATILAKNEYSVVSVLIISTSWALSSKIGDLTPVQGWPALGYSLATISHPK